jgi:hypothetical protein
MKATACRREKEGIRYLSTGHFLFSLRSGMTTGCWQNSSASSSFPVIPAKAGIQKFPERLDSRFRGNDR